jgi:hypothetical protein
MLKRFKLSLETSIREEDADEPERSTFSRDRTLAYDVRNDAVDLATATMDAIAATTQFRTMTFVALLADIAAERITPSQGALSSDEVAFITSARAILERTRSAPGRNADAKPAFVDPFRVPEVAFKPKAKS